jgi:hypothetical protein
MFHHRNCLWFQIAHESNCKCLRIGEQLLAGTWLNYYKYFTSSVSASLLLYPSHQVSRHPSFRKILFRPLQDMAAAPKHSVLASVACLLWIVSTCHICMAHPEGPNQAAAGSHPTLECFSLWALLVLLHWPRSSQAPTCPIDVYSETYVT